MRSFNLKTLRATFNNMPVTPLVIAGVLSAMGCIVMVGILYALTVPRSSGVAQGGATTTYSYVTATPIVTLTPTFTETPLATPTDLPTDIPTGTPVPPTHPAATRAPATAAPPTNTPIPPTPIYGVDLGLDQTRLSLGMTSQGKGLSIPFFIKAHNTTDHRVPFGYLGVAAQDAEGYSVAFAKVRINSFFEPDEVISDHGSFKIYKLGDFMVYFLICVSPNDDACNQPGADYRQLAPPIQVTIH